MKLVFYIIDCKVKSIFGDYFIELVRHGMGKRSEEKMKDKEWMMKL